MWEYSSALVLDEDFFRLHSGQLLDTLIYVSRYQVLVASVELSISFFNQGDPELVWVLAVTEDRLIEVLPLFCMNWDALIHNTVDPLEVLEEPDNIETDCTVIMEYWWINTCRENGSNFFINDHVFIIFHTTSASNEQLIPGGKH